MPLYEHLCPAGHKTEQFARMKDCMKPIKCPECGEVAERVLSLPNTDMVKNVRYSRSMAMSEADIKSGEANKIHPGATFGKPNKGGMCPLVVRNRHEKLKRIKEKSKSMGISLGEI